MLICVNLDSYKCSYPKYSFTCLVPFSTKWELWAADLEFDG